MLSADFAPKRSFIRSQGYSPIRGYSCIGDPPEVPVLTIRLPAEIESRLEALSKKTGRTKTFYVREAILEHLDDSEDLYLAEQRLLDLQAGRSSTVSLEDVMRSYEMLEGE